MKIGNLVRVPFVAVLIAAPAALAADPPKNRKPADDTIPFMCFTQAWDGPFKVLSARYDRKTSLLVWQLEAKKSGKLGGYEVFLGDGDGVEMLSGAVTFSPSPKEVKAGARLQASVSVQEVPVEQVAKLAIRERRK
ncbi:MAG: hypothetical protein ACJ8F7_15850 [Gemmataceae bacterium]